MRTLSLFFVWWGCRWSSTAPLALPSLAITLRRYRYKKLSILVHPDKNHGSEETAQVAFDEVKRSYERLMDEEQRDLVIATIDGTRAVTSKEHRRLVGKGLKEEDDPLPPKLGLAVAKAFADIELKRRDSEKHLAASRKRERAQEDEAKAKAAATAEHDSKWAGGERVDDRIGDWRDFQKTVGG